MTISPPSDPAFSERTGGKQAGRTPRIYVFSIGKKRDAKHDRRGRRQGDAVSAYRDFERRMRLSDCGVICR